MKNSKVKTNFLSFLVVGFFKVLFHPVTIFVLLVGLQIVCWILLFLFFSKYLFWIFGGTTILGVIFIIVILNQSSNPSFHIPWIILISLFPTVGVYAYLFVRLQIGVKTLQKRYREILYETKKYLSQDESILTSVSPDVSRYVSYMNHVSGYSMVTHSSVSYYSFGEEAFHPLLEDLKQAKKYIFLEFFIIAKGLMWNSILDILKEKVKEGVEVYVMYDGTCSFTLLPRNYVKELESFGIHAKVFHPITPIISTHYNNRDHRKVVVIDGLVGYTGGINLADEYINHIERFGVWKDNAIRITGDALKNLIVIFLENWNATLSKSISYEPFLEPATSVTGSGYLLPFGDNPFDEFQVGEMSYFHVLQTSKKYVHIITPYLILDYELLENLCNASLSGIEVLLIMPGIPDKKMIYYIGKTYYKKLLASGVRIFEYDKGFTHAKMLISDDEKAVIGTINFDYRSLYLNFENGVFLYQNQEILKMEEDFQKTLKDCNEVTMSQLKKYSIVKRMLGHILRIFAPLL